MAPTGEPGLWHLLSAGDPKKTALVEAETGRKVTFGELEQIVTGLAGQLSTIGVEDGDRVAVVLPGGLEFIELLFAIGLAGAIAAPLNPAYTKEEYSFHLGDIEPRILVLPNGEHRTARAAASATLGIVELFQAGGRRPALISNKRRVGRESSSKPGRADDIALLLHTSGTTSRAKQVPLLHRNLVASARAIAECYLLRPEDVSYCAMPLFHVHGLVASALAALSAGGSVVVPRRFGPRHFWLQAREYGITWISAGPTLHKAILDQVDEEGAPNTLRFARSCSSALPPELMARGEEVYGVPMLEAYGMTEASHQMASNPLPPGRRLPGSVGVATGTEIRVVDDAFRDVLAGAPGEVVIRGPGVTPGYLANPQANAEAFCETWFRTGDVGLLEGSYLRLVGRIKELVNRGGEKISPVEVEEVLLAHPAVADAVCFGIADERYGEEVAAAVVLSGETDTAALQGHCRERLAAFKLPKVIHVVDKIPRTPTGKLQRRRVAALFQETDS